MDKIHIEGLEVFSLIGVYDWEKEVQQKLYFDLEMAFDNKPFTTVGYMNGRRFGYYQSQFERYTNPTRTGRYIHSGINPLAKNFYQEALVPLDDETHGGEDVAIYAVGPWAHLIHGVQEQNYIYYVMKHSMLAGDK